MTALAGLLGLIAGLEQAAVAGTFNMAQFVSPGDFAVGVEPELTLSNGSGVATNVKYTHGLSDMNNLIATLGAGSGPRQFRVGAAMTFDFFPDIDGQPGIGLGTQAMYYRLTDTGMLETTAIPYLHKTFRSGQNEVQPYFAFPIGFGFSDGRYQTLSTASIGAMFRSSEHFRYVLEFGMAVNNTQSYMSGGIAYYH